MKVRIRFILELPRQIPSIFFCQLDCHFHHSRRSERRWSEHDLRSKKSHQPSPFDGERFRHRHDERISFRGAHHREPDSSVAARRLDHSLAGLELSALLGCFYHSQRKSILDGAEGVERFDLYVEVDAVGCEPVDPDNGRVADCFEDA